MRRLVAVLVLVGWCLLGGSAEAGKVWVHDAVAPSGLGEGRVASGAEIKTWRERELVKVELLARVLREVSLFNMGLAVRHLRKAREESAELLSVVRRAR